MLHIQNVQVSQLDSVARVEYVRTTIRKTAEDCELIFDAPLLGTKSLRALQAFEILGLHMRSSLTLLAIWSALLGNSEWSRLMNLMPRLLAMSNEQGASELTVFGYLVDRIEASK